MIVRVKAETETENRKSSEGSVGDVVRAIEEQIGSTSSFRYRPSAGRRKNKAQTCVSYLR